MIGLCVFAVGTLFGLGEFTLLGRTNGKTEHGKRVYEKVVYEGMKLLFVRCLIRFLVGFLGIGVICSEKALRSVGHLQKPCKLFSQRVLVGLLIMSSGFAARYRHSAHSIIVQRLTSLLTILRPPYRSKA